MADATNETPTTPDPYEDTDAIKALVTRKRDEWNKGREPFIRAAYRNLLFYRGDQWFVWDRRTNRFRPAILPKGTPTPVTNKFCLDGDTEIPCLDGTTPTIRELAQRSEMPWVYGFDTESLRVVPALAERVWKTGDRECVRVEFEEGTWVVCTPDHKFLTWKRGYVDAQDLKPGESIVPFMRPPRKDRRYDYVLQPADASYEPVHRLVAADIYGPIPKGSHVHHRNENQRDNRPENLEVLTSSEHMRHTAQRRYERGELAGTRHPDHGDRMRRLWQDPEYIEKQRQARVRAWEQTPERKEKTRRESAARRDGGSGKFANHRVRAVVPIGVREVYDICTPRTHNFAIGAGVFVHNSETVDALTSVFARVEPRLNFAPGSPNEPEDRAAADVSSRAIDVIEAEVNLRVNRQMLAAWVSLTPCAWLETGYDPDPAHGTREMTMDECPQCGTVQAAAMESVPCPACGGMMQTVVQTVPVGRMYVDVCSIFEMFYDYAITDWSRQTEYIREKSVSLDQAKARWPHLADQIEANSVGVQDGWYADALPTLAPNISDNNGGRLMIAQTRQPANRVTERWYYSLPTATYPEGLLAVMVGKEHVGHTGPLPYKAKQADGTSKPFLNHVFFPQKLVPGSGMPKTVADDLAHLQTRRNKAESAIEAAMYRMGLPIWMVPNGCNVPPGSFHGEAGTVLRYNATVGSQIIKPERVPGQSIPLSFIQRLESIDRSFESLAGTYDIIKGSKPAGVSAGIALQILQERGMSRFAPNFILWETAWAQWASQALEIFREYATEERLRKIKGRDGEWEVQKFVGADLQGRVDVIPEAGSSMPRSTLTERAEMEQLFALGILNPMDPETKLEAVKLYGKSYLLPGMAHDAKNAIREHEAFEALAQQPLIQRATPDDVMAAREMDYLTLETIFATKFGVTLPRVRGAVDDHAVHSREHRQYAKSERSESLPPIVQVLLEKMIEYHDQLMITQMQALQGVQKGNPQAGYLAPPSPMTSSSSPQRMDGDFAEMTADMDA